MYGYESESEGTMWPRIEKEIGFKVPRIHLDSESEGTVRRRLDKKLSLRATRMFEKAKATEKGRRRKTKKKHVPDTESDSSVPSPPRPSTRMKTKTKAKPVVESDSERSSVVSSPPRKSTKGRKLEETKTAVESSTDSQKAGRKRKRTRRPKYELDSEDANTSQKRPIRKPDERVKKATAEKVARKELANYESDGEDADELATRSWSTDNPPRAFRHGRASAGANIKAGLEAANTETAGISITRRLAKAEVLATDISKSARLPVERPRAQISQ